MLIRKSILFAIALVLSGVSMAQAQEWARKMFDTTEHHFGVVARGAKSEFSFKLVNRYKEEVHIASVRSSCGCTTAKVTKRTLASREEGEIIAVYNTTAFIGNKDAVLTVVFDKPYPAEVQLKVDGFIRSDVVLRPGSLNLGSVRHGAAAEQTIEIDYAGREDWKILDVRTTNPYIEATLEETRRGDHRVTYRMVVRLREDAPPGYIKEQLTVLTNDGKYKSFPIDLEGNVESGVTISPSPLFLGVLRPGQKVTKRVVIRGSKPFRILDIKCDDDCFAFEVGDEAKSLHLVPVTFIAQRGGKFTGRIHVITDLGEGVVPDLFASVQVVE